MSDSMRDLSPIRRGRSRSEWRDPRPHRPTPFPTPDLLDLLSSVRRRWRTFLLAVAPVVIGTIVLTHYWPRVYESSALLLIEERSGSNTAPALALLDRLGPGTQVDTELELLQSRAVIQAAVDSLDLRLPFEEVAERVRAERRSRRASVVEVVASGSNPQEARDLGDAVVASYLELRSGLGRSQASAAAGFLDHQVMRIGEELRAAENALAEYERDNRAVALAERASEETKQVAQLRAQRDGLASEIAAIDDVLSTLAARGTEERDLHDLASLPAFLSNPAVTGLLGSLVELENRRAEFAVRRSESNAEVSALDRRIDQIERELRSIASGYREAVEVQIRSLDATLERLDASIAGVPARQVEHARLTRQVTLLRDISAVLDARLQEARVVQTIDLPGVSVVSPASTPVRPTSPRPLRNLLIALVAGAVYGLGLVIYQDFRDTSVRGRKDLERWSGLPVLGVVPRLRHAAPLLDVIGTGALQHPLLDGPDSRSSPDPGVGIAIEALRSVAADLGFPGRNLAAPSLRTVAFTSTGRADGKTFTACNLALLRAASGVRTLLVDADLRANGVGRFFSLGTCRSGLSDLLRGESRFETSVHTLRVGGAPFWILPSGSPTSDSLKLLETVSFAAVLHRAARDFDLVIIDTPPLCAITDAAAIAARVDGVVLVVRGGVTERDALAVTIERLERNGIPIVGAILNDVPLRRNGADQYRYSEAM